MRPDSIGEKIKVWHPDGLASLELRHGTNVTRPVPRHWHDEFQLCSIQAGGGELSYLGDDHPTPPASLFIVHPGEVHSNRADEEVGCSYRTMYVAPELFRRAVSEIAGRERGIPFFHVPIIFDRDILNLYIAFHKSLEEPGSSLERDSLLMDLLVKLIARYAENRPEMRMPGRERRSVKRVREYLIENYAENISLDRLAKIADLSPFHLNRVFREEVGMPPHAFQTQVRILHAKTFLRQGRPISDTALVTGFADQSHFTRHFKRLVVVPPGKYLENSKNVQDGL